MSFTSRRVIAVAHALLATVFVACGDASSPTPPNPPPAAVPTSIAIQAGNNQEAVPGAALATQPRVVVKDANGAGIADVSVTFTVDSGGGSITSNSATTASDGTASPGTWTLGALEGRNVLTAKVGTLAPVRIVATARVAVVPVNGGTVSSGGGAVTLVLPGSALDGTTLTLPPGALPAPASIGFVVSSATAINLPQGLSALTPGLSLTGASGALKTPALLQIPVASQSDNSVMAAVAFDPGSASLTLLPAVARTTTHVTVGLGSFDGSIYASNTSTLATTAAMSRAGEPVIVVVGIDRERLAKDFDSGYRSGTDDWDFKRQVVSTYPENAENKGLADPGAAMVATSIWYYVKQSGFNGKLSGKYQEAPGVSESNRKGFRWTSVATSGIPNLYAPEGIAAKSKKEYEANAKMMAEWGMDQLKGAFLLSDNKPQPILVFAQDNPIDSIPRYGVAYRTVGNAVDLSIPDAPGQSIRMTRGDNGWSPVSVTTISGVTYTIAFIVPIHYPVLVENDKLTAQYQRVTAGTIGDAEGWPARPTLHSKYGVHDTASMYLLDVLEQWWECEGCADHGFRPPTIDMTPVPTKVVLFNNTGRKKDGTWNPMPPRFGRGFVAGNYSHEALRGEAEEVVGFALYQPGQGSFAGGAMNEAWLDWVTVKYRKLPLLLSPDTVVALRDTTVSYTATVTGPPAGSTYRWTYKGNVIDSVDKAANTHSRTMDEMRNAKMYAAVLEPGTKRPIARDSADIVFSKMWKFTTASTASIQLPPGGIGDERSDTTVRDFVNATLISLTQSPADSRINIVTGPTGCQYVILTQAPAGLASDTGYVPTTFRAALGANCVDPGLQMTLTITGTSVIGSVSDVNTNPERIVVPGGSINAVRNGRTLSGSFVWKVRYSTGLSLVTVNFQATLVIPP